MRAVNSWSYERYRPAVHEDDRIYINRTVPEDGKIRIYHDGGEGSEVFYRRKDSEGGWSRMLSAPDQVVIVGLENEVDYEYYIRNEDRESLHGFARPGSVPGTVVNYLSMFDPKYKFSGRYLCTPCILSHPDGYLLASMDVYEKGAPQNLTLIFRSDDNGENWYHLSELFPCFWGTLFLHRGEVYMIGTSTEYGDLLVGKSSDGGKTWPPPTVLLRGACNRSGPGWHKSSGHVTEHRGRLWCAIDYGSHVSGGHASSLASVPADSDILNPCEWTFTEPLPYAPSWPGATVGDTRGFIEGNAIPAHDGKLYNFLRYNIDKGTPNHGLAGMLCADTDNPEAPLSFYKFIPFPGNHSKFDVLRDDATGKYYSIVSRIYSTDLPKARNLLSLLSSPDLENWELVCDLIDYRDHDPMYFGFQYVSFIICGDDILFLSRTAANGAHTYHDSNYITFHRIKNFREL